LRNWTVDRKPRSKEREQKTKRGGGWSGIYPSVRESVLGGGQSERIRKRSK